MDEHVHWRRDFHPEDGRIIGLYQRRNPAHRETLERTTETLLDLSARLKTSSMPWFSPRYLGHMNADTLMVANLAYMATVLYNPNNVAYESAWDDVGEVTVLRSCVLTPYLAHDSTYETYWGTFLDAVREALAEGAAG